MKKIKTLPKALDSLEIGQWTLLGFLTFILVINCVCLVTKELKARAIRIQWEKALKGTEKEEIPFEPEIEEEQKQERNDYNFCTFLSILDILSQSRENKIHMYFPIIPYYFILSREKKKLKNIFLIAFVLGLQENWRVN